VLRRQRSLRIHVVQIRGAMLIRNQAKRVEMQEVRSLQIAVSVAQRRSRNRPRVERPQRQPYKQRM